jgi:transcriptional regulator with XRE-family HTH domain
MQDGTIGELGMSKVREYRLRARLSRNELAERAGIDDRTVRRAEEDQPIQDVKAAAIADALSNALDMDLTIEALEIVLL